MSLLQYQKTPSHVSLIDIQPPAQQSCSELSNTSPQLPTLSQPGVASQKPIFTTQGFLRDVTTSPGSSEAPSQQRSTSNKRKLPADFEYEVRSAPGTTRADSESQNEVVAPVRQKRSRPCKTATVSSIPPIPEASGWNQTSTEPTPVVPRSTPLKSFEFTFMCPATTSFALPQNTPPLAGADYTIPSPLRDDTRGLPATQLPSVSQYQLCQSGWDDSGGFNAIEKNDPNVSVLKDWLFSRGNQLELGRLQEVALQTQVAQKPELPANHDPSPRIAPIPITSVMSSLTCPPISSRIQESPKTPIPPSPQLFPLPIETTVRTPYKVVDYELYLDLAHEFEPMALPLTPFNPEYRPEVLTDDQFLSLILDL